MWIILHSLTGRPEPFNTDHMVRIYEDVTTLYDKEDTRRTIVATTDGKTIAVKETAEEIMQMLKDGDEIIHGVNTTVT